MHHIRGHNTIRELPHASGTGAKQLKKSITIRLDEPTIAYFKDMAEELELPYQTLINLYLRDCSAQGHRLSMKWRGSEGADE